MSQREGARWSSFDAAAGLRSQGLRSDAVTTKLSWMAESQYSPLAGKYLLYPKWYKNAWIWYFACLDYRGFLSSRPQKLSG
jgi:hypothetical protein